MKLNPRLILRHWKMLLAIMVPVCLLPIPILDGTVTFRCAYVGLVMAVYWMFEILPLPVTALFPVAFFPLLGIMSTNEVSMCYMKDTCMLYLGGLTLAIAIEDCNLHRRISLFVLSVVGTSPRFLLLGFMLATAFLSMWISNTAACAMMIPILDAILEEVLAVAPDPEDLTSKKPGKSMRSMLCMAVALASNIGGTATTIGTGPNIVFIGFIQDLEGQPLTFGTWLAFSLPQMIICLFSAWIFLQGYYLPWPTLGSVSEDIRAVELQKKEQVAKLIRDKRLQLGRMSYNEIMIGLVFCVLVVLWFFRSPGFMDGWGDKIGSPGVNDGTPAILVGILLFLIPGNLGFKDAPGTREGLLTWSKVEKQIPWGVIILFGGGFALADGCKKSGLSDWIGDQLIGLTDLNELVLLIIICILSSVLTQIVSNVTTAAIIIPIVLRLAQELEINPILLLVPPTLVCSHGFMLPVSSAPNTMAYQLAGMSTLEMAKVGGSLIVICMVIVILSTMSYGYVMFDLGTFPEWANATVRSSSI